MGITFELIKKYKDLPIVVAGESMADLVGWTSITGKLRYIGDKRFENEDLHCIAEGGYEGKSFFKSGGALRLLSNIEIISSLVEHGKSHWCSNAVCHALRYVYEDVPLLDEIINRNLEEKLREKVNLAIELGEEDKSILKIMTLWLDKYKE